MKRLVSPLWGCLLLSLVAIWSASGTESPFAYSFPKHLSSKNDNVAYEGLAAFLVEQVCS